MKNVGTVDRLIRFGAAVVLIVAGFFSGGVTRYVLWGISLVPVLAATFQVCPLWMAFKINTFKP